MDYLKEELAKCGWTCGNQAFEKETPQGPVRFVNLRARFGKAPNFLDPVRGLLTCHIDTKRGIDGFTGANDGASGAAAILETARILSGDPARAGNLELVFLTGKKVLRNIWTATTACTAPGITHPPCGSRSPNG